jgi:hypothetical protein
VKRLPEQDEITHPLVAELSNRGAEFQILDEREEFGL